MGVLIVYGKDGCEFCDVVIDILNDLLAMVKSKAPGSKLRIKLLDCQDGARAAQCIKLTGTRTVPHIFFNENYIGDSSTLIALKNEDPEKLYSMALEASKIDSNFPPPPEAAMVKVTEQAAFASQPTKAQIQNLLNFGIKSVINLCSDHQYQGAFTCEEEQKTAKEAGVHYYHEPFCQESNEKLESRASSIVNIMNTCPKPVLVHCDSGRRACFLVLLQASDQMKVSVSKIGEWSIGLGHDFSQNPSPAKSKFSLQKKGLDWVSAFYAYLNSKTSKTD